jgi:hypothetical protein
VSVSTSPDAAKGLPSGRQIRRVTADASRYHSDAHISDLFGDIYVGLFAVAMASTMVFSLSSHLAPDSGPLGQAAHDGPGLKIGWIAVLPAIAAVAALIGLATRLGPVSLSAAESSWWLPLPVDRRSLLRPSAYRWPLIGLVVGLVSGTAVAFAMPAGAAAGIGTALFGATLTVTLVIVAGLVQSAPGPRRALRIAADAVAAAVPLAGVLLAIFGSPAPQPGWLALPIAVLLGGAALALARSWDLRLGNVPAVSLRQSGAASDEAMVAVLSLDTRALGRALAARTDPPQRSRSSRMPWLSRLPPHWRPFGALISADFLLFRRTPRQPAQIVLALGLPLVALLVPNPKTAATIALLLVGAYLASLATGEGSRRAQISPALDAALPIPQRFVRLTRMALPAVLMCTWFVIITAVLGWRYGDPAEWILLGLLTGPAWAAAAVRAAYRPVPTFGGGAVYSPMGSLPPGLTSSLLKGPDIAVVGSVPIIVSLILGTTHPFLLQLQLPLTLVAVLIAIHEPSGSGGLFGALENAQENAAKENAKGKR